MCEELKKEIEESIKLARSERRIKERKLQKKYNDKSNEIYDELLTNIKFRDCNNQRYLILVLYKLKLDYLIYFISKSNICICK